MNRIAINYFNVIFCVSGKDNIKVIELPLALKTIMAGMNQTLMLSLSMAVIAALIGAGGLGLTVYVGLGRLDIGQALVGGIGIVLIAIIFDRISQKFI
jgi:glycine betaine/proline transport system permease protein